MCPQMRLTIRRNNKPWPNSRGLISWCLEEVLLPFESQTPPLRSSQSVAQRNTFLQAYARSTKADRRLQGSSSEFWMVVFVVVKTLQNNEKRAGSP